MTGKPGCPERSPVRLARVHHFGGKDGLVAAVDETAIRAFAAAYEEGEPVEGSALLRRRAAQTARVMRERPEAELKTFPSGHFELYDGLSIPAETEFLETSLLN